MCQTEESIPGEAGGGAACIASFITILIPSRDQTNFPKNSTLAVSNTIFMFVSVNSSDKTVARSQLRPDPSSLTTSLLP
jgi:hypothetical protein